MRLFVLSFLVGCFLATVVEVQAEIEKLPIPINTSDSTASNHYPNTSKADMIKASRVERAKYVAAQHLEIAAMTRWAGVNPGRPIINSGYMYLAPPRASYRWFGPMQPTYVMPYGLPIQ